VRVGSRALDILNRSSERPGELVGKHERIARVWRDTLSRRGISIPRSARCGGALGDGVPAGAILATSPGKGIALSPRSVLHRHLQPHRCLAAPTRQSHNLGSARQVHEFRSCRDGRLTRTSSAEPSDERCRSIGRIDRRSHTLRGSRYEPRTVGRRSKSSNCLVEGNSIRSTSDDRDASRHDLPLAVEVGDRI